MSRATQAKLRVIRESPAASLPGDGILCTPWRRMIGKEEAWDELARRATEPNPFFESWYLLPALELLDSRENISILCFTRQGLLCGLMPVVRQQNYDRWPLPHLGNLHNPYIFSGTPLVAPGSEAYFWRAVLDWADANPALSLFLHLNQIGLDGPVHAALKSVLAEDGRAWSVVECKERALLSSDLDAEAYLARSLPARNRKDLNRRFRRLGELGEVEFRWETGTDRIARWIDEFLALEAAGWKGDAGSAMASDPATEALFRQSLTGGAARGRLVRLSLRLNDQPIAMLSTFLTPPGAFGFKTAFDEDYSRFSPGLLLEREYLTAPDRFGIRWCDSCASPDNSVMNRIWSERRPFGRISIAIGGRLRRAAFNQLLRKETGGRNKEAFE
jgi:hypothetical protein